MATLELMMEKIRSKANQYKTFAECAKALRMPQLVRKNYIFSDSVPYDIYNYYS